MGIKHSGKSTQGRILSEDLAMPFFDTDDVITTLTGKTPRTIYKKEGKEAFMQAETEASRHIVKTIAQTRQGAVIATGGGICDNTEAIAILRPLGKIIYLSAEEKTACDRILKEAHLCADGTLQNLPAYIEKHSPQSEEEVRAIFHEFYTEREKQYRALADVSVLMKNVSRYENTRAILEGIKELHAH